MYFLINWLDRKCLLIILLWTNLIHLNFSPWRTIIASECLEPRRWLWLIHWVSYLILEFNFLWNLRDSDFFSALPRGLSLRVLLKRLFYNYIYFLISQLVRLKTNISQWFTILLFFLLQLDITSYFSNICSLLNLILHISYAFG